MLGVGEGGAAALDLSALLKVVLLGFILVSFVIPAVRRAASKYLSLETPVESDMFSGRQSAQDSSTDAASGRRCASCGAFAKKICSGCKRVRYCTSECQTRHWDSDHKFKCKQMKLLNDVTETVHLSANKKIKKVLFSYDQFLELFNWDNKSFRPCGLLNCGNSCFANVVLQCLTFTQPLRAYLMHGTHQKQCIRKQESWCFLCDLQHHVQQVHSCTEPFSPVNILSRLPNIGGNLGCGRQEDAHEFMRFAIDKMQSACLDEFGGEKVLDISSQETTIIQHIFGGRLQSQVKCTKCEMTSNRYENMMDLTVEIQGEAESLEDCLDQFTAGEWLDGDNKYKCDGCNDYVKAWKRLSVHQAPNVLTVALKRFQSGRFGKLNKRITFPTKLNLTPYMSSGDGSDLYELYAVVVHLDMLNASFFGHYICYTKDYHGWYRIDDCKVVSVETDEVLAQGAYMLLYSRTSARHYPLSVPNPSGESIRKQVACEADQSSLPMGVKIGENSMLCSIAPKLEFSANVEPDKKQTITDLDKEAQSATTESDIGVACLLDLSTSAGSVLGEETIGTNPTTGHGMGVSPVRQAVPSLHCSDDSCMKLDSPSSSSGTEYMSQCISNRAVADETVTFSARASAQMEEKPYKSMPGMYNPASESTECRVPTSENGSVRKSKELFSRGFLDRQFAKVPLGADRSKASTIAHSNGHCARASLPESHGNSLSDMPLDANGDKSKTDAASKCSSELVNGNDSALFSPGFLMKSYGVSSSSSRCGMTENGNANRCNGSIMQSPCTHQTDREQGPQLESHLEGMAHECKNAEKYCVSNGKGSMKQIQARTIQFVDQRLETPKLYSAAPGSCNGELHGDHSLGDDGGGQEENGRGECKPDTLPWHHTQQSGLRRRLVGPE